MKKVFKKTFLRNDNTHLYLYNYSNYSEKPGRQLKFSKEPSPHMRWNPFREEWVTYSSGRKNRTSFPPKKYCPFCPGKNLSYPTEIPFSKFEVAVFQNRWGSFNLNSSKKTIIGVQTKPSKGKCEVIVYSSNHTGSLGQMSQTRLQLLIHVWIDRYLKLLKLKDVKYVLPFENRGKECGVTLHHPHGQIYAYPFIPPVIQKEIKLFKKTNFLVNLINNLKKKYILFEDNFFISIIPPFARYAYEIWLIPKKRHAGPWSFNQNEVESFAYSLKKIVKCLDKFSGKKCPYIMGLHAAPKINDKKFHFHVEFYPPLRHKNKPKILAGSESMAGVFIMDVLPEESVKELRKFIDD